MNINISLSTTSIERAIRRLTAIRDNLNEDVGKLVDVMATEAAEVARASYGSWGVSVQPVVDKTTGVITVSGNMPLIAEFGAGDATLDPSMFFENSPDTPVFPGSYSLFEGSREYYNFGSWRMPYAYVWYTEVPPRHGLFDAKLYLTENSTDIAREVFWA